MDTLNQFVHSHVTFKRKNNNVTIKRWYYYKEEILSTLEYHYSEYIDEKHNKLYKNETYYNINNQLTETITPIEKWLEIHIQYLINSNEYYKISLNTIEYIKKHIGNYNTYLPYKCFWYIPKILKLTIDLYSNQVILYYKNTETILCDKKLKSFIQKNKKTILYAQDKLKEYSNNKITQQKLQRKETYEKEQDTLLENQTIQKEIKPIYFYIKKSLKERYEIQACKPLPVIHPWDNV
jgi:hypothetical protein